MEGVTPGPWSFQYTDESGECFIISENLGGLVGAALPWPTEIDDRDFRRVISNARYIAACNPVAMREVLALARQAEALQREIAEKDKLQKVVNAVLTWAEQQCPCKNEQPNPCPLCGASVENLEPCKSAENTIPRHLLDDLRRVRARALLGGSENAGN